MTVSRYLIDRLKHLIKLGEQDVSGEQDLELVGTRKRFNYRNDLVVPPPGMRSFTGSENDTTKNWTGTGEQVKPLQDLSPQNSVIKTGPPRDTNLDTSGDDLRQEMMKARLKRTPQY